MKKVYVSETEDPKRSERPVVRWKDKVKEYMCERVVDRERGIELARRKYMDRERWRLFCNGHPLERCSRRKQCMRDYSLENVHVYFVNTIDFSTQKNCAWCFVYSCCPWTNIRILWCYCRQTVMVHSTNMVNTRHAAPSNFVTNPVRYIPRVNNQGIIRIQVPAANIQPIPINQGIIRIRLPANQAQNLQNFQGLVRLQLPTANQQVQPGSSSNPVRGNF